MNKNTFRPRIFSTDQYKITLPEGHKFPVLKYGMLRQIIENEDHFQLEASPLADPETVSLAHNPDYVTQFTAGTLPAAAMRRIGLPWSEILVNRAFASVGGTVSAALAAMEMAGAPRLAAERTMPSVQKVQGFACSMILPWQFSF